jgi:hypothetical protein
MLTVITPRAYAYVIDDHAAGVADRFAQAVDLDGGDPLNRDEASAAAPPPG